MRADVVVSPEPTTDETSGAVGPVRGGNRACAEFRRRLAGEQPRRPATVAHWLAFRGGGLCLGLGATNARQRRSRAPLWACFCCYIRVPQNRPAGGRVMEQSHDLDAYRCSECLRPLGPRESVTVGWQQLPWWGVCLSCSLITRNRRCQLDDPLYSIQRCRCEGCGRPSERAHRGENQPGQPATVLAAAAPSPAATSRACLPCRRREQSARRWRRLARVGNS